MATAGASHSVSPLPRARVGVSGLAEISFKTRTVPGKHRKRYQTPTQSLEKGLS